MGKGNKRHGHGALGRADARRCGRACRAGVGCICAGGVGAGCGGVTALVGAVATHGHHQHYRDL